ncbi:hypothetical protein CO058_01140 [candidate division WWE3 bacterium CG_4_9_14_0_2_um_filter_35_11]|uniref:Uncharacterized protein n=1 Tax=candidate division WWE3 bacterium CG_4_9_14_0_2_um_filter_35_11 TaxID=1975077 RepID=A0A2M8EMB9_UNCKA|nr:MAG: hypothetical protein COV25_03275 [candidate division WWE3 bacterium CG10_big_fil_rev_8_21_14_0_10_35_32]PJC23883.1 MAG: hypothetical protein CO058_01140 [candidate division WWE3 bacterium CG_4_9_14_0_2_um_filter_35_11]
MKILKIKNRHKVIKTATSNSSPNQKLIKRMLLTNGISLLIVVGMYFWMVFFISNVGSFWDLFRKKEIFISTDTIAPAPPFLVEIPKATQNDSVDISGKAESGVKVTLYTEGSKSSETTSDSEGTFSFTGVRVGIFPTTIYTTATDESDNESKKSQAYSIVKDATVPELEVITPKNGEEIKSTGHTYKVTGKTEPDVTITVNGQLAIINQNGEFSVSVRLEEGDNSLEIIAKDIAQNETTEKRFVKFRKID